MNTETLSPAGNQVAIIEKSVSVFKNAGAILTANSERSAKAIRVGQKLLAEVQEKGMTPKLDTRVMEYLAKVNTASKEMKEGRAEVTQIMDELRKMYTEVENNIDPKKPGTVPAQLQSHRDEFVKQQAADRKRKEEEAQRAAEKKNEEIELRSSFTLFITNALTGLLASKKAGMQNAFNTITLENIGPKSDSLINMPVTLQWNVLAEKISMKDCPAPICLHHDGAELTAIANAVYENYPFGQWVEDNWTTQLTEAKQDLIDKLPSKKAELEEAKRLADEAAAELERQRIEKEKRDAEIAQANAKEKKRLEAEAEKARIENEKKNAELRQQQERAEADRKQREADEAERLRKEAAEASAKAAQEAEIQKQGEQTMTLFEKEAALAENEPAPEARQGYDITVTHQAGFVQLFTLWFEREGKGLPIDKFEKTSFTQIKSWCEKLAHKSNEKIESKFLKYEPSYKAVNRKVA